MTDSQSRTKNNLNVFKRRTALNLSSKTLKEWQKNFNSGELKKVKNKKEISGNVELFDSFQQNITKLSRNENRKCDNLFQKQNKFQQILENIEQRGGKFYRFGFKSHQKSQKRLFAQVVNVVPSKMKGTMHVGEMWSTSETSKFMKENRIFVNKLKLMDKLKKAKKQQQKELIESTNSLSAPLETKNSISSRFGFGQANSQGRFSVKEIPNNVFKQINESMGQINRQLKSLKPLINTERNIGKIRQMKECLEKLTEIDNYYHQQISEWI